MRTLEVCLVFFSHALALMPFLGSIRRGKLPNTAEFATISVILYYDVGLLLEMWGYPYVNAYFKPLLDAGQDTFVFSMLFLALAPWLFHAGSALTGIKQHLPQEPLTELAPGRRRLFYAVITLITIPFVAYSAHLLLSGSPLWLVRVDVGATFGPLIIILYLPLHFLAFYVRQKDSRTLFGLFFLLGLAAATVIVLAPIGERTNLLLPFLILLLFRFRITILRITVFTGVLFFLAAVSLTLFKWQYAAAADSLAVNTLVSETVYNDISRDGVLRTAIELSPLAGTQVMPYPMAGYVYSGLFFVPRQIVPFKGGSTAQYYTARVTGADPDSMNWGFGVGVIEELMVNGGTLLVIPGLLVYGMILGLLDRASWKLPELAVPTRLAAIWLCGYHLPAILLEFGAIVVVLIICHAMFVRRASLTAPRFVTGSAEKPAEAG